MRGGTRSGAGRKKGSTNGKRAAAILGVAHETGEMPLEYMLRVMRDATADTKRRDAMAIAAASFAHPKLAAVEVSGNPERPIETVSRIELVSPDVNG